MSCGFPLRGFSAVSPRYLLLDEALAKGIAQVTETSTTGSVPELRFENRSDQSILIVDGEALVGAKQNRIVNISILVPPQSIMPIPVSCVERGRWPRRCWPAPSAAWNLLPMTGEHLALGRWFLASHDMLGAE